MGDAAESHRLANRNLELLESGNFADAEIICGERVWKVHKLILRSGCVWFEKAFANNWEEAQTGRIHVEEQHPEQVNDVLEFIYSGRYTRSREPLGDPDSNLWENVSLWQTADFFLLPDLKTEVHNYLLDRFASTLEFLHFCHVSPTVKKVNRLDEHDVHFISTDLLRAVKKAHESPAARELQKLLAIFACGLREHLSASMFRDLMKTPGFQKDISTALILSHFEAASDATVAGTLEYSCSLAAKNARCSACTRKGWATGQYLGLTLDPFSSGTRRWCEKCAFREIRAQLRTLIEEWPAETIIHVTMPQAYCCVGAHT